MNLIFHIYRNIIHIYRNTIFIDLITQNEIFQTKILRWKIIEVSFMQ